MDILCWRGVKMVTSGSLDQVCLLRTNPVAQIHILYLRGHRGHNSEGTSLGPMNPVLTDTLSQSPTEQEIREKLERRLGRVHARQRLGIERDHESIFGHGINFFHIENWYSIHSLFRIALKLTGLYWRGHENP